MLPNNVNVRSLSSALSSQKCLQAILAFQNIKASEHIKIAEQVKCQFALAWSMYIA